MTDPRSPFLWQGKPSIFTTGENAHHYTDTWKQKELNQSLRAKPNSLSLPGGSKHTPPELVLKEQP